MSVSTYRKIPFTTRISILFGGFKSQFGWFFLGFGLVFFWAFAMNSDFSFMQFKGKIITTEGIAIRSQDTDASEGDLQVYENYFRFTADDGLEYEGISYATGQRIITGDTLTIEYPEGKPQYARILGMRMQTFSTVAVWTVLFPLVGLVFILMGTRRSLRALRLLKYGILTKGVLVSKKRTNTKINGRVVFKMTFQFQDEEGSEYTVKERTTMPYNLQDQKEERLLYLKSRPSNAMMLDALPASATINRYGYVEAVPIINVIILLLVPIATIIGHGIYVLNHYFSG